jgi:branched-chain amino acid transport system permease protein
MATGAAVIEQLLNGLTIGVVYVLLAAGLSIVFGVMDVVNFAHGELFALGAYLALAVVVSTGAVGFWVALFVAPLLVAVVGAVVERVTLRPLYGRDPIYGVLVTFGLAIVVEEGIFLVWGPGPQPFSPPGVLQGPIEILGTFYPRYRLFVIVFGVLVAVALWLFLQRTRIGMIVRAGNLDSEMVEAMGINVQRIFTGMFGVGVALAAMGGIVAGPVFGVYPTMGTSILIEAFIVVVIGGLGSIRGSFVGALIVGISQSVGSTYISQYVSILLFALMIVVLLFRPYGIYGQPGLLEANA